MASATKCANCDIALDDVDEDGVPRDAERSEYCCDGCAEGGPCTC